MYETIEQFREDIIRRIEEGGNSRHTPMHTPTVATADADLRIMVLRDFDRESWTLRFHTDTRSPKVAAIAANPQAGVLFYDPEGKLQVRVKGIARVESTGAVADAAWAESTPFAKRCYLAQDAPGAQRDAPTSGLPEDMEGITPTEEQVAPARPNFAVLLIEVQELDCLSLANTGHRRVKLTRDGADDCWLVP